MSFVTNYGTIEFNKELTVEAIEAVKKEFGSHADWYKDYIGCFEDGATDVELEEYSDKEMYGTLVSTVNALKPLGYVLNGCIEYYGDYGEGATYVKDNEVVEYDDQTRWHMDATDEELIKELESRGYVSVKKDHGYNNLDIFNGETSRAPGSLISDAINTLRDEYGDEDGSSLISKIIEEAERDTESDKEGVRLLHDYDDANDHDKSVMDMTLVTISGWTLKSLLHKIGIDE